MRNPRIEAKPVSLFGDFSEEEMNGNPNIPDKFYIPGYSDARVRRELEIAEAERDHRTPNVKPLEHRFQWVRTVNAKDLPDKAKSAMRGAQGYRTVQWDQSKALGIDLEKSAADKGADGSVRLGEYTLMVCDRKSAARNLGAVQRKNEEQLMSALAVAPSRAGQTSQMAPQIEEPVAKK